MTSERRMTATAAPSPLTHLVVLAGAGTGKTQMLSGRYLDHLHHASPLEIVAVTFTEKAASELRARIRARATEQQFPPRVLAELEAAPIGTIHALAARVCHEHPGAAGFPEGFVVMDATQRKQWHSRHLPRALARLDAIPSGMSYQQIHTLMTILLEDPYATLRSLPDAPDKIKEAWLAQLERSRYEAWRNLLARPDWQAAYAELRGMTGPTGDRLETLRLQIVNAPIDADQPIDRVMDTVRLISGADLRGGSKKAWGDEAIGRVREVIKELRALVQQEMFLEEWNSQDDALLLTLPALARTFLTVNEQLLRWRLEQGLVEFSDLEGGALKALETPEVRAHYQARFKAILVDECQDTSPSQASLLNALAGDAVRTFVGDPLQAIYSFRTGRAPIHEQFKMQVEQFGGAEERLTHSYRTHTGLIGSLNQAMAHLTHGAHVDLSASRPPLRDGQHMRLLHLPPTDNQGERLQAEAHAVANEIRDLLTRSEQVFDRELGTYRTVKPSDIAILARRWKPLDTFQQALLEADIPVFLAGGGHLLRTREAQDAWIFLRAAGDPTDDLATAAALRTPLFDWSDSELHALWESRLPGEPWQVALTRSPTPAHQRARRFFQELRQLRHAPALDTLLLADRFGYRALITQRKDSPRALADWDAILQLVTQLHDTCPTPRSVALRLRRLQEEGQRPNHPLRLPRPPIAVPDAVTLASIHHAKGLEWPVVFVVDLDGKTRPEADAAYLSETGIVFTPDPWTEERPAMFDFARQQKKLMNDQELDRLLYVAATRARDLLYTAGPADSRSSAFRRFQDSFLAAGVTIQSHEAPHDDT